MRKRIVRIRITRRRGSGQVELGAIQTALQRKKSLAAVVRDRAVIFIGEHQDHDKRVGTHEVGTRCASRILSTPSGARHSPAGSGC